jgi:hypothetical protein
VRWWWWCGDHGGCIAAEDFERSVAGREITDESTTSPFSKPAKLATCCVTAAMVSRKFKPTFR